MLIAVNMSALNYIFPKVRVRVLEILFVDERPELHIREITRRSGLSLRTVQRELALLSEAELISSRKDGNRQYFRANSKSPIYGELHSMVNKEGGSIELLREALSGAEDIEIAFIFGSIAEASEKSESDIDLFVIGTIGLRPIVKRLSAARSQLHREINPYNLTAEEWQRKLSSGDTFVKNVAAGKKIFIVGSADELSRLEIRHRLQCGP